MNLKDTLLVKRIAIAAAGSLPLSYLCVVLFLMFGPLYIGNELAIAQSGKLTMILAPFVGIVLYAWLLRNDKRRRVHGI